MQICINFLFVVFQFCGSLFLERSKFSSQNLGYKRNDEWQKPETYVNRINLQSCVHKCTSSLDKECKTKSLGDNESGSLSLTAADTYLLLKFCNSLFIPNEIF